MALRWRLEAGGRRVEGNSRLEVAVVDGHLRRFGDRLELVEQGEPAELRQSDIRLVDLPLDRPIALRAQVDLAQGQVSLL